MPTNFKPIYIITLAIAKPLMRIEDAQEKVDMLAVRPALLPSLPETAKWHSTHYSNMIEVDQLKPEEIKRDIQLEGHFPGRAREDRELTLNTEAPFFLTMLTQLIRLQPSLSVTEKIIQIRIQRV